ncbi:hypothetical protein G6L99_31785 [Agrobacterium rhizogenes]|nr:hypothetical protein [Rhizobium rhizogenes]NTH16696.1 hypothetical protein [Rhizobium rhizogenes]
MQTIWKAHGLIRHRFRQVKLLNAPAFAERLTEIVGLCFFWARVCSA